MNELEIKKTDPTAESIFYKGRTLPVKTRIHMLKRLRCCILKYQEEIRSALKHDLGKSRFESYMCETGLVLDELRYMLGHIREFSKEKAVPTPLSQFASRSYVAPSPYGVVLIMSPWNYPFLLSLTPLVDCHCGRKYGHCQAKRLCSRYSGNRQQDYLRGFSAFLCNRCHRRTKENTCVLNEHFDYIFFTGSQHCGKRGHGKGFSFSHPGHFRAWRKKPLYCGKNSESETGCQKNCVW